jgi:geranylgeranyl reductase family protein
LNLIPVLGSILRVHDVIIVGGGPIGSYVAYRLAEAGHRVMVLERKRHVGEAVCCTGIVSQECAKAFAIEGRTILRQVNSARLSSPSGNQLRLWREATQACILDRTAFDISLMERARGAGAEYEFNSSVKDIAISRDRASVAASRWRQETVFESRAVVIASGFSSGLGRRLGLGGFGDFTVGAQAEVEAPGVDEVEVYFGDMAPGFFAWVVPTVPPMARVGLMSRKNPGLYLRKWLEKLAAQGRIASPEVAIICKGIPLKPRPRTYGERLVVVGDAAGQVKPTTGGGIYYGLLGADITAQTVHQALEDDDLSAKRMARYERRWRKRLGQELKIGYWARRLFERLSDRQLDRLFEIIRASGIDEALLKAEDLPFDWHSRAILKLMGYQILSRTIGTRKIPFTG